MPTPRAGDLAHHFKQPFDFRGGERGGRLVHDQDARGVGQRLGDGDDLPAADREFANRLIDIDLDPDRFEAGAGGAPHRRPIEHARAGQLPPEKQVGGDIEARHEIELLEDGRDAGAPGRRADRRSARTRHRSACRRRRARSRRRECSSASTCRRRSRRAAHGSRPGADRNRRRAAPERRRSA